MKKTAFINCIFLGLKRIIFGIISFLRSLFKSKPKIIKGKENKPLKKEKEKEKKPVSHSEDTGFQTSPTSFAPPSFLISFEELRELIKKVYLKELDIKELYITKEETLLLKKVEEKICPLFLTQIQNKLYEKKEDLENELKKEVKKVLQEHFLEEIKKQPEKVEIDSKLLNYKKKVLNEEILFSLNEIKHTKVNELPVLDLEARQNEESIIISTYSSKKIHPASFSKKTEEKISSFPLEVESFNEKKENFLAETPALKLDTEKDIIDFPEKKQDLSVSFLEEKKHASDNMPEKEPEIREEKQKLTTNKEKLEESKISETISFSYLLSRLENIALQLETARNTEDLENTDFENLEMEMEAILFEIYNLKQKNKEDIQLSKVALYEQKGKDLQHEIKKEQNRKIEKEKQNLQEELSFQAFDQLKEELHKLKLEDTEELNRYALNKIEDLELLALATSEKIEKELLISRLKKATFSLKVPFLLTLPFMKNRYFMALSCYLLLGRHLHSYKRILKHQTLPEMEMDLEQIQTGKDALEETCFLAAENKQKLEKLETETLLKFPDLKYNPQFQFYMNQLKKEMKAKESKILKKKDVIQKYHLSSLENLRILKRKINHKLK